MIIKSYIQFIKESSGYEYGCVMVEVPVSNWDEITSYINPEDVYTGGDDAHGIQENPHVTILYGLHEGVTEEDVKSVFEGFTGSINIEVDGIGVFENKDYDVVKFNVNPDGALQDLHDKLSEFPNSNSFPDYKPHITIAYVNKGTGKKYVKPEYKYEVKNVDNITYSMPSGEKVNFKYNQGIVESLNENKMWYKTIPQILEWLESKSKMTWLWIDTETTGLGGPKQQQLTQVSALATDYSFQSNTFNELGLFDEKIKLTDETKSKFSTPEDRTKWVLGFNHYGSGKYKYKNEQEILDKFFDWTGNYEPCLFIAQNAGFDMAMLAGRYGHKINNEVFDTKMLIQLYYLPLLQKLSEVDSKYKDIIDFIGTSSRDGGLISSSMSKVGPALGINMTNYHDALTDCRITIQMYQKMVDFLKQHQEVDIMKYQTERIKVIKASK
jgi:2'-5' RNA ligase/DNA polymerase III epsilon subunit-like protein